MLYFTSRLSGDGPLNVPFKKAGDKTAYLVTDLTVMADLTVTAMTVMKLNSGFLGP